MLNTLTPLESLQQDQVTLAQILDARRAVTVETLPRDRAQTFKQAERIKKQEGKQSEFDF